MNRPLRIYLADLVHTTSKATNYTLPLNIGWVAAYLNAQFDNEVDIKLFKYPQKILGLIKTDPPDVLGLSNYMWNYELNRYVAKVAKQVKPDMVVTSGGPNIRHTKDGHEAFHKDQSDIDIYTKFEGERAFAEIITRLLGDKKRLRESPIPGCTYLEEDRLVDGGDLPKTTRIIEYPSPYLTGLLDDFLNESLIPIYETNRGCPFKCTFCAWGVAALDRVTQFPLERIIEEMRYVYTRCPDLPLWIFADANFGIFPRDVDIAWEIRRISDKSKRLRQVLIWWAKNAGERTKAIAEILGPLSVPYVAMQSLDADVLKNIKRDNISIEKLLDLMKHYHNKGLKVTTDILLGLPGESRESHYESLRKSLDYGFDSVKGANLILLPGTEVEESSVRNEFDIKSMFRLREGSYGMYDGVPVLEFEEIVTETSTMKREEFLEFRMTHWLVMLLWNTGYARPLLRFARAKGINPIDVIKMVAEGGGGNYSNLRKLLAQFWNDAKSEFLPDLETARSHYTNSENFEQLEREGFSKLNFKYTAYFLLDHELTSNLFLYLRDLIASKVSLDDHEMKILKELTRCCFHRIFFVNYSDDLHLLEVNQETLAYLNDTSNGSIEVDVETGHYIMDDDNHHENKGNGGYDENHSQHRCQIYFRQSEDDESTIKAHLERLDYQTSPLKAMEKALEFMRMMSFVRGVKVERTKAEYI